MIHRFEQRSDEWFAHRCGRLTASRVADAVAKTKSGWGASRANLMAELAVERLTGVSAPGFTNAAMQWGVDHEDEARTAYEFHADAEVEQVGFVDHPSIEQFGCSPDGLVGDDGMVEIKCPNSSTHIDTLLGTPIADKYIKQIQAQLMCAERSWCDFVSYDPRMPEALKLHIERVQRDDKLIASIQADIEQFLIDLDAKVAKLNELMEAA